MNSLRLSSAKLPIAARMLGVRVTVRQPEHKRVIDPGFAKFLPDLAALARVTDNPNILSALMRRYSNIGETHARELIRTAVRDNPLRRQKL